jgi:hypothetical protein
MPITNYPNGFKNGVSIQEIPLITLQNANGNVFHVDSNKGSNGNTGTFVKPFATIDYAVGRCTADQGDTIVVAAGHIETVVAAAGLDLDVAGITIIFLGEGANRGVIRFGTAVSADMDVDAANITMINPRFQANIDALTGPIDVNAANFKIINGEYYDGSSVDTTDCVVTAATATGLKLHGWKYTPGNEGGTQKQSNIQLNGVDNAELIDIDITGDFATGNIENVTDEVLNVRFENIKLKNTNSGPKPGMVLDANATGQAKNVDIRIASGTTYTSSNAKLNWDTMCLGYNTDGQGGDPLGSGHAGGLEGKIDAIQADIGDPSSRTNFQNLEDMIGIPDAANSSVDDILRTGFDSTSITSNGDGSILEREEYIQDEVNKIDGATLATAPTANSLAAFIASGGTALGTELADSKSLVDALGSDGTTLAYGSGSMLGAIGTLHVVSKTLTSSNITQAGVDITGVSSGGALMIEDIFMNTDGTGLATGTNFQIDTDNANGVPTLFAETVANLGANKTESLTTGSVTAITGGVLETGKKLIAKSTVADCTGAGTITIVIKFRRVAAGATVAAA